MSGFVDEGLNVRQVLLISVSAVCLGLSTVVVVLRFVVRQISAARLWWDDWIAMLALVCLTGLLPHGGFLIIHWTFSWLPSIFTIYGESAMATLVWYTH